MENEPSHVPSEVSPVDEWDSGLVGYEPQSDPLHPCRDEEREALERSIRDARGTDFQLVRDRRGRLSVWRRAHDFWNR